MPLSESEEAQVRGVVVDALRFCGRLEKYIQPVMQENDVQPVVKAISHSMREKLSRPVCFAALNIIMRMAEFAEECEEAFRMEREPGFPKPRSHLDYTVRLLWQAWMSRIEQIGDGVADWTLDKGYNPYSDICLVLDKLVSRIWSKHFYVKDL